MTDVQAYPSPGEQLHGFTLKRCKYVPELQLTALQFEHDKTGADYLHIAREDSNNVFSISFKTNPPDATGVPHILEHTTLCGSQRYPVRDPFFKMLPRTLSNFMNAFTSSDHTTYPFATANSQDYKNLMSVYLDCTLNPLLQKHDYEQEGWRLGPQDPAAPPGDDKSKLIFKGVVYNEMKGQMSDAGYLYYIKFNEHLFPAINNSGGDPQKMTDLTYEQLKNYHARHYHPSNSKILTYGDMPLASHLEYIGNKLNSFDRIAPHNQIMTPERIDRPINITVQGPVDPMSPLNAQHKTSVTWLMGSTSDTLENFSLSLMTSLLTDGYGSPMYRNLIEAGLGTEWSPNTGYDGSSDVAIFSLGLNGVKRDKVDHVHQVIRDTLNQVRQRGFEQHKIQGLLHQMELGLKHKTANFGMSVMQRLIPGWFNGVDVFRSLDWQRTVDAFKAECAKGDYLESLLEKYLLSDRTMTFTMEPSTTHADELVEEESQRLAAKIQEASTKHGGLEQATKYLNAVETEMITLQNQEQDLSCLPTVHVKDIPVRKAQASTISTSVEGVPVRLLEAPTNGLTYFRAVSVFENLPVHLRTFVPLFCDALMRIGTTSKSMEEIEDLIKLKTGGISFGYYSASSPSDTTACNEGLSMSGFALDGNVAHMFEIMSLIICETDFDGPKAQSLVAELLQSAAAGVVDTIASSGHSFARRYAEAGLTVHGRYGEQTGGITQAANIATLVAHPELSTGIASELIKALKAIQSNALGNLSNMRVALTCGHEQSQTNLTALSYFLGFTFDKLGGLKSTALRLPLRDWTSGLTRGSKTFFELPYQVSYSGLALPTVPYTDPSSPTLAILAKLLTNKYLHREIREKGGAYSGGAYSRALDGVFGFYAYRDPNPENTLRVIDSVPQWTLDHRFETRDLDEAKLSVFQSIDAPRAVSQEGVTEFLSGVTPAMEQTRREALLNVSLQQIKDVTQKFLVDGIASGNVAMLGQKKAFVKESDGWSVERLGLGDAPSVS